MPPEFCQVVVTVFRYPFIILGRERLRLALEPKPLDPDRVQCSSDSRNSHWSMYSEVNTGQDTNNLYWLSSMIFQLWTLYNSRLFFVDKFGQRRSPYSTRAEQTWNSRVLISGILLSPNNVYPQLRNLGLWFIIPVSGFIIFNFLDLHFANPDLLTCKQ